MGHREVRRVPLDFDAPLNEVWRGYINPNPGSETCTSCGGTGYNKATKNLADLWYDHDGFDVRWGYRYYVGRDGKPAVWGDCRAWMHSITQDEVKALVDGGRLRDFTQIFVSGEGWKEREDGYIPTADEVNEWSYHGFGHDAINRMICVEARAKRLGVYGLCEVCHGDGEIWPGGEDQKARYEAWQEDTLPRGEGWQMWTTTTEGSPISPVFSTPEALADYCADHCSIFGSEMMSRGRWLTLILEDDVVSGSMLIGRLGYFGVAANEPL